MTCHILHNPVMTLPIYNCDGCNPAAVEGYCATVGSGHPAVTHDECFRTLSNNSKQCSFGLPLEQSHLVRHPPTPRFLVQSRKIVRWGAGSRLLNVRQRQPLGERVWEDALAGGVAADAARVLVSARRPRCCFRAQS